MPYILQHSLRKEPNKKIKPRQKNSGFGFTLSHFNKKRGQPLWFVLFKKGGDTRKSYDTKGFQ